MIPASTMRDPWGGSGAGIRRPLRPRPSARTGAPGEGQYGESIYRLAGMRGLVALLAIATLLAGFPARAQQRPPGWEPPPISQIPNFREEWRQVVQTLATYAKGRNPNFVVLMRGGAELLVKGEREADWEQERDPDGLTYEKRLPLGTVFREFIQPLDGLVLDGLYCGPYKLDKPLAEAIRERRALDAKLAEERGHGIRRPPVAVAVGPFSIDPQVELKRAAEVRRLAATAERQRREIYAVDAMRSFGRTVMSVENCASAAEADAARSHALRDRVLTFAADGDARLDVLPPGHAPLENADPVTTITAARNWLPMLHGDRYGIRAEWVAALAGTNYDVLVVDVAHRGTDPLTKADVAKLHFKNLGPPRLVLAELPIGRAFDTQWYWQKGWAVGNPPFLYAPDSSQPGAYIADLANPQWKELLGKYIAGIMAVGFDGVMLDDLDTYLWFEDLMPLNG